MKWTFKQIKWNHPEPLPQHCSRVSLQRRVLHYRDDQQTFTPTRSSPWCPIKVMLAAVMCCLRYSAKWNNKARLMFSFAGKQIFSLAVNRHSSAKYVVTARVCSLRASMKLKLENRTFTVISYLSGQVCLFLCWSPPADRFCAELLLVVNDPFYVIESRIFLWGLFDYVIQLLSTIVSPTTRS